MKLPSTPRRGDSWLGRPIRPRHDDSGPVVDLNVPTVLIADPSPRRALPFGLEQPLELRGYNRIGLDEGCASLPLDWLPLLLTIIDASCAEPVGPLASGFRLPAMALEGSPGCGRSHIARQISAHFDVPIFSWDMHKNRGSSGWGMAMPVVAQALFRCANPIIAVMGADHGSKADLAQLAGMMDPVSGRNWFDPVVEATLDMGHITWLVYTADHSALAPEVARSLITVPIPSPGIPVWDELIVSLIEEVARDLKLSLPIALARFERAHVLVDLLVNEWRDLRAGVPVGAIRQAVRAGLA